MRGENPLVIRLALIFFLSVLAQGASSEVSAVTNGVAKIKIAVYSGGGALCDDRSKVPPVFKSILTMPDAFAACISAKQVQDGILTNFDVAIFPEGTGHGEATSLGESGCKQVREFVGHGGKYIGICAGAYLCISEFPWSLKILNAQTLSPKWERGEGEVTMELTDAGRKIFGDKTGAFPVFYENGPVIKPDGVATLPNYEVLAYYRSERAEHDSPKGIMIDSPAMVTASYGAGRVIFISPHPEKTKGLENFLPKAVSWLSQQTNSALIGKTR